MKTNNVKIYKKKHNGKRSVDRKRMKKNKKLIC